MAKTALYRHFDAAGALLYVGISNDVLRRLMQHKDRSSWAHQIARIDVEWLPDRARALRAESVAIERDRPLWNRILTKRRPSNFAIEHIPTGWRDGNYADALDADDMLDYWSAEFKGQSFRLIEAEKDWPNGATDGRQPLRPNRLRELLQGACDA